MMKVFVTTFYKKNYGSALQAFALQSLLKQLGANPVVVEEPIRQESCIKQILRDVYYLIKPEKHYGIIKKSRRLIEERFQIGKIGKINKFVKDNIMTISYEECKKQIENGRGIALAGSDQIWSIMNAPISPFYLFSFVQNRKVKKISYAASIGLSNLTEEQKDYYYSVLKDFDVISFREKTAYDLLNKRFDNNKVRCDIDPTLLMPKEFWKKLCENRQVKNPYIFVYMLRPDDRLIEMARILSKEHSCAIYFIGQFNKSYKGVETVTNAGVEEFLSYIYNAEYIITNSFHGTVFSILFEKKFASVRIESTSSRVEDLLSNLQLQDKLVTDISGLRDALESYDAQIIEKKLDEMRKKSISYLKKNIEDNMEG